GNFLTLAQFGDRLAEENYILAFALKSQMNRKKLSSAQKQFFKLTK
ncbi:MAG: hypothetical protein ACI9C9_001546, partial [Marivirga sp.]